MAKKKKRKFWKATKKYGKVAVRKVYDISSAPATKKYAKGALRTAYGIKRGMTRWERELNRDSKRSTMSEKELKKRLKNIRRISY